MATKNLLEITAYWGNHDAHSSIKLSLRKWEGIKAGARFVKGAWSYYEGTRQHVVWSFEDGAVTIDGEDNRQCIVDLPVEELIVIPL